MSHWFGSHNVEHHGKNSGAYDKNRSSRKLEQKENEEKSISKNKMRQDKKSKREREDLSMHGMSYEDEPELAYKDRRVE